MIQKIASNYILCPDGSIVKNSVAHLHSNGSLAYVEPLNAHAEQANLEFRPGLLIPAFVIPIPAYLLMAHSARAWFTAGAAALITVNTENTQDMVACLTPTRASEIIAEYHPITKDLIFNKIEFNDAKSPAANIYEHLRNVEGDALKTELLRLSVENATLAQDNLLDKNTNLQLFGLINIFPFDLKNFRLPHQYKFIRVC